RRADAREVRRVVQRRQRYQPLDLRLDGRVDDDRSGEARASVDDAMADDFGPLVTEQERQRLRHHLGVSRVGKRVPLLAERQHAGVVADALCARDLARGALYGGDEIELQARAAGVHDQDVHGWLIYLRARRARSPQPPMRLIPTFSCSWIASSRK